MVEDLLDDRLRLERPLVGDQLVGEDAEREGAPDWLAERATDAESLLRFIEDFAELAVRRLAPIDLLYMDGPADPGMHLAVYRGLRSPPRFVLWDDIILPTDAPGRWPRWPPKGDFPRWAVKGELAIPAMLEDGYRIVFERERQVLLCF